MPTEREGDDHARALQAHGAVLLIGSLTALLALSGGRDNGHQVTPRRLASWVES